MLTAHYSNILVLFAALAALVGGSMTCPRAISPGVEVCEDTCGCFCASDKKIHCMDTPECVSPVSFRTRCMMLCSCSPSVPTP